jgi:uncharacterized OB-fold protein
MTEVAAHELEPYGKPVPLVDSDGAEFWARVRRHAMAFQECQTCGRVRYPPRQHCPACLGSDFNWVDSPTRGTVYSFVTFVRPYRPAYADEVPYNVSLIELPNGVRLWSNVVGIDPDAVRIGMPVELFYDDRTPELTLPQFRPVA